MSADRDIRRLNKLLDVSSTQTITQGDAPRWETSISAYVPQSVGGGGAGTAIGGISNSQTMFTSGTVSLSEQGAITIASGPGQVFKFSVNPQSVQPETQTFIGGISASNTLYTSGTVRFTGVGGGITVSSNTGQRVDLSVAAQTEQTQNVVDLTIDGNTAGALALISSGTATLAGGSNITLSQAGNAVTIIGQSAPADTQTAISGIKNSQTTFTSGTVGLSEIGAITIRSTTGNQFQFSVNPQSVQPETQTFVGGVGNSQTTYTSGTVNLSGLTNITVRSTTGNAFQLSVADQSVQPETQTFIGGVAASNTTYTSGTVRFTGVGGGVTVSSNTGQRVDISVAAQSAQTGISGIANSQTTYTSGTVSMSELGAITIRSTTGNQYQFSVNAQTTQTDGILNIGVSTAGNTSGNTTVNSGSRFVFVGTNNITLSEGTAANATTLTISGPTTAAQTNQTGSVFAASNTTGTSSGTYDARTLSIAGDGMISVAASNSGWRISATQSVQTQDVLSAGVSSGGNTSGNTTVNTGSRLVFAGGNNITLSQGTAAGATTITISAPNLGAGSFSGGVSNLGNTAGSTGVTGTRGVFVGTNAVSLSQSTDANGGTITWDVATTPSFSAGVSNLGNTAGSTGVSGTRVVMVGSGDLTLSQSTNASGATITFTQPQDGTISMWPPFLQGFGYSAMLVGASQFATGAGTTTLTGTVFPMPMGANFSGNYVKMFMLHSMTSATTTVDWSWTGGGSLGIFSLNGANLSLVSSFSNQVRVSYDATNNSTNASASFQMSYGSGTNLSSSTSFSTNNAGNTNIWSSISNSKGYPFASGALSLSVGQYFGVYALSSSSAGGNLASISQVGVDVGAAPFVNSGQEVGRNVASITNIIPLHGIISFSQTDTGIPVSIATANATTTATALSILNRLPVVHLLSSF